jgi:hypothetical protein
MKYRLALGVLVALQIWISYHNVPCQKLALRRIPRARRDK